MWCKHCRQDTPGIRSAKQPGMRCGRCGASVSDAPVDDERAACDRGAGPSEHPSEHPAEIGLDLGGPFGAEFGVDDLQLAERLRSLQARLGTYAPPPASPHASNLGGRGPFWRFDAAHGSSAAGPHRARRQGRIDPPARRSNPLARGISWLGLAGLAVGGFLLGWALVEHHAVLWTYGLPSLAAGGIVFLLGLILQLERIWKNSRYAVQKLRRIDEQLRQLERTTSMLGVTHGSASQAFYAHMADGANPHLLLADLKGQLDLLAMDFARRSA